MPYTNLPNMSQQQRDFNEVMAGLRVSVEWTFAKVSNLWQFLKYKPTMRLYQSPVTSYWKICALLTNCHSCCYGNQTSMYFHMPVPPLEDYVRS